MLKKNSGMLHLALLWVAGLIILTFAFWLCWQGFLVDYVGLRALTLLELLAFFGLLAFLLGVCGLLIEVVRERK